MPTYISLYKWTEQGIKNVKDSPERLDAAKKGIEAAGGKLISFYLTIGRYDMVTIGELPSDEALASFMLSLGAGGNVRSETMKAFPEDQYREIVAKVK